VKIRDISLGLLLYILNFSTLHSPHKFPELHNHAQEMTGLSGSLGTVLVNNEYCEESIQKLTR